MRQLALNLIDRSYNIYINNNLFDNNTNFFDACTGDSVLILSNKVVGKLYIEKIKSVIKLKNIHVFLLPDGEVEKNLVNYSNILDYLVVNKFRRNDTLISLGGGVIGDLGGFVAASYQRGMNFIQVPTSLLAQVDSSVGGKTAINHKEGKNLIGAFYQPNGVFINLDFLESLPEREYISGFAEIVKYAILGEFNVEKILQTQTQKVLTRDKDTLKELIYYSCAKKAEIVAKDEKEKGNRALLNLGHTFAHAIEKATEYKKYLHGEAVSIGIHIAIDFSTAKKLISKEKAEKYHSLLSLIGLPKKTRTNLSLDDVFEAMALDKKNINKDIRLILPTDNNCIVVEESDVKLIKQVINKRLC